MGLNLAKYVKKAWNHLLITTCYFVLQGVVVYVDDLIVVVYVDDLIVAKHNKYCWKIPHVSKFHLLKANGAGSLFHWLLVLSIFYT